MEQKSSAETIIDALGGLTKTAKLISTDEKTVAVSTVQGWKERGRIPEEYWERVMVVASELGLSLRPSDFMPVLTAEIFDSWFDRPETAA